MSQEPGAGTTGAAKETGLIYANEVYQLQGAVFEVYRELGCGFLESVYQECLECELRLRSIPFVSQQELAMAYKGQRLAQAFRADLVCYGKILVEIKAVRAIADDHRAQVHNYLRASGMRLALLVNFGHYPKATVERIIV